MLTCQYLGTSNQLIRIHGPDRRSYIFVLRNINKGGEKVEYIILVVNNL